MGQSYKELPALLPSEVTPGAPQYFYTVSASDLTRKLSLFVDLPPDAT
jgi:hypothetical protein